MRSYPPATIRPPNQGNTPAVLAATGLGAGGGAGLSGNSDSAGGHVRLFVGLGPSASGTLSLQWPVAPPAAAGGIVCFADWATLAVAQGNPLVITWTAIAPLVPNSRPLRLDYQWTVAD
jgi:hypothetical protein